MSTVGSHGIAALGRSRKRPREALHTSIKASAKLNQLVERDRTGLSKVWGSRRFCKPTRTS
jgi:hypothetical protein